MSNKHVENDIQSNIRVALSEYGIVIRNQVGLFYTKTGVPIKVGIEGLPDLQFIGDDGSTVWIEVKKPKGVHREAQENFIRLIQSKGHKAGFVESVDDALKLIGKEKNVNK